jgi:catechol 2,3-dioxygenase-like lactoylglutathione lyase family enzyme
MQYSYGRLIDHVHLTARDLAQSRRFYAAVLGVLGIPLQDHAAKRAFSADELWVTDTGARTGRVHLAFQARDRVIVDRFYAAGLAAGGVANGVPGERPYHPGYYAAYLLDPDGNNIEAVHHGSAKRSAGNVTVHLAVCEP